MNITGWILLPLDITKFLIFFTMKNNGKTTNEEIESAKLCLLKSGKFQKCCGNEPKTNRTGRDGSKKIG